MIRRITLIAAMLLFTAYALADGGISVTVGKQLNSFQDHVITINVPADGDAQLIVSCLGSEYQRIEHIALQAGSNELHWDGLGYQGEPIPRGQYTLTVTFASSAGEQLKSEQEVIFGKPKNALLYAIPETDVLYLGDKRAWHVQLETTVPTDVMMKLFPVGGQDEAVGTVKLTTKKGSTRAAWNGKVNGKKVAPGDYLVRCFVKGMEAYTHEFTLTVTEEKRPSVPVSVTGPIIPSRTASDEEIWQLMTAPAVVFATEEGSGNPIYAAPRAGSDVLGYVHGKGTALEVLRIE